MKIFLIKNSICHWQTPYTSLRETVNKYPSDKVFVEAVSGKDRKRPKLKEMMDFVQDGDVVVVHELSRLGRSVVDLYDIAKELKEKGVGLESLKENIVRKKAGKCGI